MAEEESEVLEASEEQSEGPEDEQDTVVELEPAQEAEFTYDETADNLCFQFSKHEKGIAALEAIAGIVREDFDADMESNEEYRQRCADDWKLFCGELPPKPFPFDKSANMNVPILMPNAVRLVFRMKSELFSDWQNVFGVSPIGPDDQELADILTVHGNWQIREQLTDFPRQMDRGMLIFLVMGDVTCHSFYDPIARVNRHEVLTPDEFITPYVFVSTQPDYSDVPHRTKITHRHRHEILKNEDNWYDIEKVLKTESDFEDEPESKLRAAVAQVQGEQPPTAGRARAPRKILVYEGWLELPNQESERFCQVTYDYQANHVLKLRLHEREDWRDAFRFERESQELQQYQAQAQQFATMRQQMTAVAAQNGIPEEQVSQFIPPQFRDAPKAPAWVMEQGLNPMDAQPRPVRMEPIHLFSHGVCIENLSGTTGLGYGRTLADLNRAANTAQNQFTDAASLGNIWSVITAGDVKFEGGFSIAPGKVNKVVGMTGQEFKENFIELKPSPANPQMMDIVKQNVEWGEASAQSPGVLSGEEGKSGETWRGIASRIEQATKQLSVLTQNYALFLKQILRNNAYLNAIFLPDWEIIEVTARGVPRQIPVSRKLYQRNYNVEIRSDLRFAPKAQKIMEQMDLLQLPKMVPPLQMNARFVYESLKRYLEARGDHDLIPMLGQPPPPPQQFMVAPPPPPPGAGLPGARPGGGSGTQPGGPPPARARATPA